MDKFRLIAEVRKRPILWNFHLKDRPLYEITDKWKEVASSLGEDVTVESCKVIWKGLRDAYRVGKIRKRNRIERDKRKCKFDPEKDYSSKWVYYESMKYFEEEASKTRSQCSSDSDMNQGNEETTHRESEKRNKSRNRSKKTRVRGKTQQDPPSVEIGSNTTKLNSSLNDNNITSHSSTSESTLYELNIIDDADEEELLKRQEVESLLSHVKLYRKENKRKSPKRRINKITTPKQKQNNSRNEKSLIHSTSLNKTEYIPTYSSKPKSSYYQINFMDDTTDQEELAKYQEIREKSCPNDNVTAKTSADNNFINEKPVIEIESDTNPMNNEESNSKAPISPKRQRLMRKHSTPKQTDVRDPVKQNSTINDSDYIPTYSSKPKSSYYQINFIEDTEEEDPILNTKSLNHPGSIDKSGRKYIESFQQPDDQILKVAIKEEPALTIAADSYLLDDQESNATCEKEGLKEIERQSPEKNSTTKQKPLENTNTKLNEHLSLSKEKYDNKHSIPPPTEDIDDPDYKFLLSFSSHIKSLTALQNLQFRAKMSDLILSFITTSSASLNAARSNMKALAVHSDPDCNFLSSFWPYMTSLSQLENLQFRGKMSFLMVGILSKD